MIFGSEQGIEGARLKLKQHAKRGQQSVDIISDAALSFVVALGQTNSVIDPQISSMVAISSADVVTECREAWARTIENVQTIDAEESAADGEDGDRADTPPDLLSMLGAMEKELLQRLHAPVFEAFGHGSCVQFLCEMSDSLKDFQCTLGAQQHNPGHDLPDGRSNMAVSCVPLEVDQALCEAIVAEAAQIPLGECCCSAGEVLELLRTEVAAAVGSQEMIDGCNLLQLEGNPAAAQAQAAVELLIRRRCFTPALTKHISRLLKHAGISAGSGTLSSEHAKVCACVTTGVLMSCAEGA